MCPREGRLAARSFEQIIEIHALAIAGMDEAVFHVAIGSDNKRCGDWQGPVVVILVGRQS
jgi:hypothetical protein